MFGNVCGLFLLMMSVINLVSAETIIPINYEVLNNTISTNKLQDSSVTSSKIAPKAVTFDKIDNTGAADGYVLKYSASSGKFLPLPETGGDGSSGVTGVAIGSGMVNFGSIITSTGTLAVDIGTGSGQVAALDSSGNFNTQHLFSINHAAGLTGYLSLKDSVSGSDFRFYTAGSFKITYTDDYLANTDPAGYAVALEISDIGNITTQKDLSVGGQLTVNSSISANTFSLPITRGSANDYLASNGLGGTVWTSFPGVGGGTITRIDTGVGLVNIAGGITTFGTLNINVGTAAGNIVQVRNPEGTINPSIIPYGIDATRIGPNAGGANLISNAEFLTLNGVTSNIQGQFDALSTTYQAKDANLDDIAGMNPENNFLIGADGLNFVTKSPFAARTSLGLGTMATQNSGAVAITGGTISSTQIGNGAGGDAAIYATNVNVSGTLTTGTLSATNFSGTANASVNGTVVADNDSQKATIGAYPAFPTYVGFWRGDNASYSLLADANDIYLNANTTAGSIYFRSANSDLVTINGSSGNLTLAKGSVVIPSTGGLTVHGNSVINSGATNNWLRTYGDTGWYSQTYGGGWYMTDANWVTSYNGKKIRTAGSQIQADLAVIGTMLSAAPDSQPENYPGYSAFWRQGAPDYSIRTNGTHTYVNAPTAATGEIYFRQSNDTKMTIKADGSLLLASDTAQKAGGGAWTASSDRRLKDIHGSYEKGLEEIRKINPIVYNYKKDNPKGYDSSRIYQGAIAQEVMRIFPEAVEVEKDGYYVMKADPIWWASINAIKELDVMLQNNLEMASLMQDEFDDQIRKLASLENESAQLMDENVQLKDENREIKQFLCKTYGDAPFCEKHD